MFWSLQKKLTSIVILIFTPSDPSIMLQLKPLQMLFLVQVPGCSRLGSAVIVSIAVQVAVDCC